MRRRTPLILPLVLGLVGATLTAGAQPERKAAVLGYLSPTNYSVNVPLLRGLRDGLKELGYVEGENFRFEFRFAEGNPDRLPDLAADLVRLKVDLILATSPPPGRAARAATTTIPIVLLSVSDPVDEGFAVSLARPGGNVTGNSILWGEGFTGKWLELLKAAVPDAGRMAILKGTDDVAARSRLEEMRRAGHALGVSVATFELSTPGEIEAAFVRIKADRTDALIVMSSPFVWLHKARIAEFAAKHRLPAMYSSRDYVEIGGLMAYGVNFVEVWRQGARYVDRILKGAWPGDLAFEQPTKVEFVINMKTAKALGLTIPQSLRLRANHVIE